MKVKYLFEHRYAIGNVVLFVWSRIYASMSHALLYYVETQLVRVSNWNPIAAFFFIIILIDFLALVQMFHSSALINTENFVPQT